MAIQAPASDSCEPLNVLEDPSGPKEGYVKACDVRWALGAPCWPLYHGTSTHRLQGILRENCLRVSETGDDHKVALTPDRSVAEYFAHVAVLGDRDLHRIPEEKTRPVVLELDGDGLIEENYDLQHHSDPVWGEGECDWEQEIACWGDIGSLDEVLINIQEIPYQPGWRPQTAASAFSKVLQDCFAGRSHHSSGVR
jgi:hypothetical protein